MSVGVAKIILWVVALIPFYVLVFNALNGYLIDPIEEITNPTGQWALRFLMLTLCITPIMQLTTWVFFVRYRRALGLITFFYMVLHVSIWLIDQQFSLEYISEDIMKRRYILLGALAFVMTFLLAITSNNWSIRKLKKRWKKLHYLVYPILIISWLHFYLQSKSGMTIEAAIYLLIILLLLGARVVKLMRNR